MAKKVSTEASALNVVIREYRTVKDGKSENPAPISIPTDKGIMSICGHIAHTLHKQTQQKLAGITQKFAVYVNDELALQIGDGFTLKFSDKYLKEAGVRALALKDFKVEWPIFKAQFTAIAAGIRYHLGAFLPEEVIAESYVKDAKSMFGVDVKAKKDLTSFTTQSASIMEKLVYQTQIRVDAAREENTDEFLRLCREATAKTKLLAAEQKKAAKLLAAGKK